MGQMVSPQEQETLELRALKLQKPIKGTFGLSTPPLRVSPSHTAQFKIGLLVAEIIMEEGVIAG